MTDPFQQAGITFLSFHLNTGVDTFTALGAGEHLAFQGAWFEAHGTNVITGIITVMTLFCMSAIETDGHGIVICHPGESLNQAH